MKTILFLVFCSVLVLVVPFEPCGAKRLCAQSASSCVKASGSALNGRPAGNLVEQCPKERRSRPFAPILFKNWDLREKGCSEH